MIAPCIKEMKEKKIKNKEIWRKERKNTRVVIKLVITSLITSISLHYEQNPGYFQNMIKEYINDVDAF